MLIKFIHIFNWLSISISISLYIYILSIALCWPLFAYRWLVRPGNQLHCPLLRAAALHAPKLPHLPNAGEPGNFDLVSVSQYLDGWFHGKSQTKMDDTNGYPHDLGNLHVVFESQWIQLSKIGYEISLCYETGLNQ